MADQYRINNNIHSWASMIAKVNEDRFFGFTDISYGDKRERQKAYGMGRHQAPRGRTHGKYTVEPVKIGGPKSSIQALREGLARNAADQISYGDVEFQFVLQYFESDDSPITVVIERLVIVSNQSDDAEGADVGKDAVECDAMLIRRNGLTLFDSLQGVP
jgi:hypothetical protein